MKERRCGVALVVLMVVCQPILVWCSGPFYDYSTYQYNKRQYPHWDDNHGQGVSLAKRIMGEDPRQPCYQVCKDNYFTCIKTVITKLKNSRLDVQNVVTTVCCKSKKYGYMHCMKLCGLNSSWFSCRLR